MSAAGVLGKVGSLITTDIPTKQLLVFINRENGNKIILQDLDDTHVLVDSRYVQYLKDEVARLLEKNIYGSLAVLELETVLGLPVGSLFASVEPPVPGAVFPHETFKLFAAAMQKEDDGTQVQAAARCVLLFGLYAVCPTLPASGSVCAVTFLDSPNPTKGEISDFLAWISAGSKAVAMYPPDRSVALFAPSPSVRERGKVLLGEPLVRGAAVSPPPTTGLRDPLPLQGALRRPDAGVLGRLTLRGLPHTVKTSMEPELALLMANLVLPSTLSSPSSSSSSSSASTPLTVLDPFCGAGLLLLAAAQQQASLLPLPLPPPGLVLLGSDAAAVSAEGIAANMAAAGLRAGSSLRVAPLTSVRSLVEGDWPWERAASDAHKGQVKDGFVDCILTDPPYGMGARVLDLQEDDGGVSAPILLLLRLAERRLRPGRGRRLVFFCPSSAPVPDVLARECPSLRLVACHRQDFSPTFSRFLVVLEKL